MSPFLAIALLIAMFALIGVFVVSVLASRKAGPGHGASQHEGHFKKRKGGP